MFFGNYLFKRNIFKLGKNGFTLAELLVSIAIIGMISTIFLVNYQATNERSKLSNAVQKVVSDIRLSQNYALGFNEFSGSVPTGGWGTHFDTLSPDNYIIFADVDGGGDYDIGEEFKIINLPTGVDVNSLNIAGSVADIIFLPPDPVIYVNGVSDSNVQIIFSEPNGTQKTVEVNFLGLVDVIN